MNDINNKIKETIKDNTLRKHSIFIICTFGICVIIYNIIKNITVILPAFCSGISTVLGMLTPLFIGMVLAYLVCPLVDFFQLKLKIKNQRRERLLCTLGTFILILAALVAVVYAFVAMIAGKLVLSNMPNSMDEVISLVKGYENSIMSWADNLPSDTLTAGVQNYADKFIHWITGHLSATMVLSKIVSIGGGIANVIIGLIISIYLVYDKQIFIDLWNKTLSLICPRRGMPLINTALHDIDNVVSLFLRGIIIDAGIVAILSSIGLTILGLKFAVFVGIFAGLCNVIPYFGPILGMIPAFLIGAMTGDVLHGVIAVVILFGVQQIDANLIYPRVVGNSTGLHPLFVLIAVTVGGSIGGLAGMILAVPVAGVIRVFLRKWAVKREQKLEAKNAESAENSIEKE